MAASTTLLIGKLAALADAPPDAVTDLEAALSRADRRALAIPGQARLLFSLFGHDCGGELPAGAVSVAATEPSPEGHWLRLDAANLSVGSQLVMNAFGNFALGTDEYRDLSDALGEYFAPSPWTFHAPGTGWYLRADSPFNVTTTPPDECPGRDAGDRLPGGPDADRWRLAITETQMLLHNHPVNRVRLERGQQPINSLWIWGAGSLPKAPPAPFAAVTGGGRLAAGLGRLGGTPAGSAELLVVDGGAADAACWHRWLDRTAGRSFRVLVPEIGADFRGGGWRGRRFWRRRRGLAEILRPAGAGR